MQIVSWRNFMDLAQRNEIIPDKIGCYGKQADGITLAQQKCLRRFGIGFTGLKYKGQAMIVISIAIERANAHMATPGQMWALTKCRNIKKQNIHQYTFDEARKILNDQYIGRIY